MSNLTPVKRADRNGKLVTRHVKNEVASSQTKPIPAPVAPVTANAVSADEYNDSLRLLESIVNVNSDMLLNLSTFAHYHPDEFREVIQEFSTASPYKAELWKYVLDWPNKDTERFSRAMLIELHVMETVIELNPDGIQKYPDMEPYTRRGKELMDAARLSLSGYRKPKTVGQRKATIFALWAKRFKSADDRLDVGKEIDNLTYIAENFDAVMKNRKVIRDRGSIDRDFINVVINNQAPAISEGLL